MMKRTIYLLCICLLVNCNGQTENKKDETTKYKEIPQEKQITYGLQLNMKLPYELYINDIKATYNYVGGNIGVDMNPYLLRNGKCKIRIKIFPSFKAGKIEMPIVDIQNSTILFGKYIRGKENGNIHDYNLDDFTKLNYKLPNKPVPLFEQEWEIDIKELPYEVEGWSKGQDLRTLDQKQLEKNVVSFHEMLRKVLNDGKGSEWGKLTSKRFNEALVYDYVSSEQAKINFKENEDDVNQNCKNTMIPLEDYEMKLYEQGKIVSLERKTNTLSFNNEDPLDIKGWSPLIRKYKVSGGASYGVKLYLPQGSNEFVIIRK